MSICVLLKDMMVRFWHQMVPSCFGCYKLNISMISYIFHSFPKTALFINLKPFPKITFCLFFLALYSCQFMILDFMIEFNESMRFSNTDPWFSAYFKFLMLIKYSFLIMEIGHKFFQLFQSSFFWLKMVNQLQENILHCFLYCSFLWNLC